MTVEFANQARKIITERQTPEGPFANKHGGAGRADATCWGILAVMAVDAGDPAVRQAQRSLTRLQQADGRVCLSSRHTDVIWPTTLAVLAWTGCQECREARQRALQFLLTFDPASTLRHEPRIVGHDTTIRGWPWTERANPWLEPTAYGLMALRMAGLEGHERAQEARRLVMDRQLPAGGWNYGNTLVYGQELRAIPESTGIALQATAGLVPRQEVAKSLEYLRSQLPHLCTPFALAWTVLGLATWKEAADCHECIRGIADRGETAAWDTVSLSLLVLASCCPDGLLDWLQPLREEAPQ